MSTRRSSVLAMAALASACTSFDPSGMPNGADASMGTPDARVPDASMVLPDAIVVPPDAMVLPDAMPAGPVVVSYWRMEADTDIGLNLSVANEIPNGSPLTGGTNLYVSAVLPPVNPVPKTGALNVGSLARSGGAFNAVAAYDPLLDVTSIGIEYWARLEDTDDVILFARSRNLAAEGIRINNPENVRVRYNVSDGAGGNVQVSMLSGHNMDANWHHYAFTYDEVLGVGRFYVDGVEVVMNNGPDNRPLVWDASTDVELGPNMVTNNNDRVFDELRIWNGAPTVADFLMSQP